MTLQQQRSDTGLATALRISVSRLARRLRVERLVPELAEPALSDTQLAALATLERHGAMSPGDLAEHEKVQPPSMTRVLAGLEEMRLVARRPHPTDGRQAIVALTDEGRAFHDAQITAREAWLDRRLAELTDQERELLARAAEIIDRMAGQ